jgi:phosphoglucomutase
MEDSTESYKYGNKASLIGSYLPSIDKIPSFGTRHDDGKIVFHTQSSYNYDDLIGTHPMVIINKLPDL